MIQRRFVRLFILILFNFSCCYAQEVSNFSISPCEKDSYPQFVKNRIIDKLVKNDTLIYTLGMVFNCCSTPTPEVRFSNDSLFLTFSDYSNDSIIEYCGCECCYELNVEIANVPTIDVRLFHEFKTYDLDSTGFLELTEFSELKTQKNKYIFPTYNELIEHMRNSEPGNITTSDGQRTGLWFTFENELSESPFTMNFYIIDSNRTSRLEWTARFDSDARLIEISKRTGPDDMSIIMGGMYYDMFGIHVIKD